MRDPARQKKDGSAQGIDDRNKRNEGDAHPGEKITDVFQGMPPAR